MTYREDYKDSAFLNALTNEFQDVSEIAEKIGCAHQLAKLRLNRLTMEGRVIRDKKASSGREGFKYVYIINKDFKEPKGGFMYLEPKDINQTAGILLWYRSKELRLKQYEEFAEACKAIIKLSDKGLKDVEITGEHVRFTHKDIESRKGLFYVPRLQNETTNTLESDKLTRTFGYCKTDNAPYTITVIACLVALRQFSNKTTLQFNCDYELIKQGILLAEKVLGAIDRKFLFNGTVEFPKVGKVQDAE
jgi:hypothetical protein